VTESGSTLGAGIRSERLRQGLVDRDLAQGRRERAARVHAHALEVDAVGRAHEFLSSLGVEDVADKRAGEMSGGQAQRVAVARALVTRPRVIFADEPTGSLDSTNGELVMELLVSTARRQASTVVIVTHEPQIAAYADREIVVRDGRLAHDAALV